MHVYPGLPGHFRIIRFPAAVPENAEELGRLIELVLVLVTHARGDGEHLVHPERGLSVGGVVLAGNGADFGKIQIGLERRQGLSVQLRAGQGCRRCRERR